MLRQTPADLSLMEGTHWKTSQVESITQQAAHPRHILWNLGYEVVRIAEPTSLCFLPLFSPSVLFCNVITNKQPISPKSESPCDLFCNDVGVSP